MKPSLRDYLYFSKAQRRGVLGLLLILFLVYGWRQYFLLQLSKEDQDKFEIYAELIQYSKLEESKFIASQDEESDQPLKLFNFDPNQIGLEGWKALGFSEKQALSILNYRAKGGKFKVKADLAKMYVVSEEKFRELKAYILLADTIPSGKEERFQTSFKQAVVSIIELNTADSLDLISLKGIGPVYASRILKYKKLLGGYCSLDQLKEVWGLKDSTVNSISERLRVESSLIQQIDINHSDTRSLAAHPYIDWNTAKAIVNYREQHGSYSEVRDLQKIYLMNDSLLRRIFPYLAVYKKDL